MKIRHIAGHALLTVLIVCGIGAGPASRPAATSAAFVPLSAIGKLPPYLLPNKAVLLASNGIRLNGREYLRTAEADFLTRDFVWEVIVSLKAGDGICFVGLGQGVPGGAYGEPGESLHFRFHAPDVADGEVQIGTGIMGNPSMGKQKTPGTHKVQVIKKGNAVTFSIFADWDGKSTEPTFTHKVENLPQVAPFLNERNTHLFFGGGGIFRSVRLEGADPKIRGDAIVASSDERPNHPPSFHAAPAAGQQPHEPAVVVPRPPADPEIVEVDPATLLPSDHLEIISARYGAPGHWADVTQKVREAVSADRLELVVGIFTLSVDPAQGIPKDLVITWRDPAGGHLSRFPENATALLERGKPSILAKLQPMPQRIGEGIRLQHRFEKNSAGRTYSLISGPHGLTLSRAGILEWTPSAAQCGAVEITFRVVSDGKTYDENIVVEVVSRQALAAAGGKLDQIDSLRRLPIGKDYAYVAGIGSALLIDDASLTILAADGFTVRSRHELKKPYIRVAERADYYLALSSQPPTLDLIDKTTFAVRRSIKLDYIGLRDMAINPTTPTTYVAVQYRQEVPRDRIVVVDEASGETREPRDFLGTYVAVDPSGQRLVAGLKDMFVNGSDFFVNPDGRVVDFPTYGNIDTLLSYDLEEGRPKPAGRVETAGVNGSGVRLSPDGKRIAYLSLGGCPSAAGNLAAWDPADLEKKPVVYSVKGIGATTAMAFHPTLPIIAAPGLSGGAIFFDRDSGDRLPDLLPPNARSAEDAVATQIWFSPDGLYALLDCGRDASRSLRAFPLMLSAEQKARIAAAPAPMAGSSSGAAAESGIKCRKEDLGALVSHKAELLTPREISRQFTNSVVLIETDAGSGTGCVVGNGGFILTNAHVVRGGGDVRVTFNYAVAGQTKAAKADAQIVRSDSKADLALLKLDSPAALVSVILAADDSDFGSGDQVTVIGNPGLGKTILTNTLTTGVVSNPRRTIDGQPFIQTTAAINPGNSGGPMFDAHGQVVGIVARKADIDSTGFAIPEPAVRAFLLQSTSAR